MAFCSNAGSAYLAESLSDRWEIVFPERQVTFDRAQRIKMCQAQEGANGLTRPEAKQS